MILVLGSIFIINKKFRVRNSVETLSSKINENIEHLTEISTIKYNYTNLVDYKDSYKISGIKLPFTNKGFLVKYSGYLKAGVDEIDVELKDNGKTALVTIGKPKIQDNVINEEDVYFFDEKNSIFNPLKFDNLYDILKEEKIKIEQESIEKGILNDAEVSVKNTIKSFLESLGVENIIFK